MRLFGWVRIVNIVFGLCVCLILIGLTTAAAAQPMATNNSAPPAFAISETPPVIQVWKANPMVLDTATSFAVYTFKVRGAMDIQMNEAGVNIKSISNPSGATLQGTANGNPASSIPTDQNGQFICTIVASNPAGSVQAELTLSLAKDLLPQGPPTGSTGNQTTNKSRWLEQTGIRTTLPPVSSTTNPNEPDFFKCPESCKYCLEPGDAARLGFTQRCSDQRCFYDPKNTRSWYCYSEPEGWCCANQQVSQTTKSRCAQINGYWSLNQYEAQQACQPTGFCCLNNQVYYPITEDQCRQRGGSYWSTNQAEVTARCQPPGCCCVNGQIQYPSTQSQCTQMYGTYYTDLGQCRERCQSTCWCCAYGKVFQATQAQCSQSGGACYSTQSQAAAACRLRDTMLK